MRAIFVYALVLISAHNQISSEKLNHIKLSYNSSLAIHNFFVNI